MQSLTHVVEANTHLRLSKLRQSKKQGAAKAGVKTRAKKKLVQCASCALARAAH
jgi:hypothetical protein